MATKHHLPPKTLFLLIRKDHVGKENKGLLIDSVEAGKKFLDEHPAFKASWCIVERTVHTALEDVAHA
jgi:hypothetical protein